MTCLLGQGLLWKLTWGAIRWWVLLGLTAAAEAPFPSLPHGAHPLPEDVTQAVGTGPGLAPTDGPPQLCSLGRDTCPL